MCLVVGRWNIPWMIHILVRTCYWSYLLFYWDLLWPSASGICFMKLVYQHSLHISHNHILCSSLPYDQLWFESLFIKMGITILAYKFCFVGYHFSSLFFQSVFFVEMLYFLHISYLSWKLLRSSLLLICPGILNYCEMLTIFLFWFAVQFPRYFSGED